MDREEREREREKRYMWRAEEREERRISTSIPHW